MKIMYIIFTLGALCLVGMLYYIGQSRQPGVYPPKRQMRSKALMLGLTGAAFLLLGFIIHLIKG